MRECKIAVIGGGPGGYVAAIRAAQLGATVFLIEKDKLGGTCLHHGCIPTKALVRGVSFLQLLEKGREYGITASAISVDFARMQAQKDRIVSSLCRGLDQLMVTNKIEVIKGVARLVSPNEIEVKTEKGVEVIRAEKIILAPGSVPVIPPIPGALESGTMTSDDVLKLTRVPASLLIIGGGVIGVEFATIFAGMGTKVTLVEKEAHLIPGEDTDISVALKSLMKSLGVAVFTGSQVKNIGNDPSGVKTVMLYTDNEEKELYAEFVLASAGRQPNIDGLGILEFGMVTHKGGISVNQMMETSVPGIYAVGDAVGGKMLAHMASREGIIAAENAMGNCEFMDYLAVPRGIHCNPEIAAVGMTENEARAQGYDVAVGRFPLTANGMASILKENGFIKIIADTKKGKVLGVHILAPHATEMIGEATLAMKLGAGIKDIADTIHNHPSISEGFLEAALDATGEAIHLNPRSRITV